IYSAVPWLAESGLGPGLRMTAGASNFSDSESLVDMFDVNGDGLPDYVYSNTGAWQYSPPQLGWWVLLNRGNAKREPLNVPSGTIFCDPVYPKDQPRSWPIPVPGTALRMRKQSYSTSSSTNRTWTDLLDWNGDGLLDLVSTNNSTGWSV